MEDAANTSTPVGRPPATRRRWVRLVLVSSLVAAIIYGGFSVWRGDVIRVNPDRMPLRYDEDGPSADLTADLKRMWETAPLQGNAGPNAGPNPRGSTDRAIHAASRVFNTVSLDGKTRDEVAATLGDPKGSNDSIYNFPFWPAPQGAMVYRFDTGAYGWQFNVVFGLTGRVSAVERHWIH